MKATPPQAPRLHQQLPSPTAGSALERALSRVQRRKTAQAARPSTCQWGRRVGGYGLGRTDADSGPGFGRHGAARRGDRRGQRRPPCHLTSGQRQPAMGWSGRHHLRSHVSTTFLRTRSPPAHSQLSCGNEKGDDDLSVGIVSSESQRRGAGSSGDGVVATGAAMMMAPPTRAHLRRRTSMPSGGLLDG